MRKTYRAQRGVVYHVAFGHPRKQRFDESTSYDGPTHAQIETTPPSLYVPLVDGTMHCIVEDAHFLEDFLPFFRAAFDFFAGLRPFFCEERFLALVTFFLARVDSDELEDDECELDESRFHDLRCSS